MTDRLSEAASEVRQKLAYKMLEEQYFAVVQVATALRSERDKLQRIVELEKRAYDRLQLCSDHRDKATGICIVCQAEHRTQEELRGERDEARQQRDQWLAHLEDMTAERDFEHARAVVAEQHKVLSLLGKSSWQEKVEEDLRVQLAESQVAVERLQQVVHRYAKHPASCPKGIGIGYYQPPSDATCNCGIDDALLTTPPVPSEPTKVSEWCDPEYER